MSGEDLEVRPAAGEDQWQPIETAPRDGTPILVWMNKPTISTNEPGSVQRVVYGDERWRIGDICNAEGKSFGKISVSAEFLTHWMPVPSPPRSCAVFPPPPNT